MANKMSDQIKLSFNNAIDQAVSFTEENKLGYAGITNIETPQTSTPAVSGEQKPVVQTSDTFQFLPPPYNGKCDQAVELNLKFSFVSLLKVMLVLTSQITNVTQSTFMK